MKIRFGDCILDVGARRLARGNRDVHLPPKAFEVLRLLVECRARALSKNEILEQVWPGVFVSDASLAKVISRIRAAIGDRDEAAPMIRTVHGYGYAFAGSAAEMPLREAPSHLPNRVVCWLICGNREFALPNGEHLVGRDADATVCLDSPQVSRRHAKLVVSGVTATLEDLGSKNGSFVKGVRIDRPTRLQSGDETRIGPFTLVFRVDPWSGSTQTAMR